MSRTKFELGARLASVAEHTQFVASGVTRELRRLLPKLGVQVDAFQTRTSKLAAPEKTVDSSLVSRDCSRMRLLLDESVPAKLRRSLPNHEVRTVVEMGWSGVTNGRLLALAADKFKANRVGPRT